jgi:hypothetical protein
MTAPFTVTCIPTIIMRTYQNWCMISQEKTSLHCDLRAITATTILTINKYVNIKLYLDMKTSHMNDQKTSND